MAFIIYRLAVEHTGALFAIALNDREYMLRASKKDDAEMWVTKLNLLKANPQVSPQVANFCTKLRVRLSSLWHGNLKYRVWHSLHFSWCSIAKLCSHPRAPHRSRFASRHVPSRVRVLRPQRDQPRPLTPLRKSHLFPALRSSPRQRCGAHVHSPKTPPSFGCVAHFNFAHTSRDNRAAEIRTRAPL